MMTSISKRESKIISHFQSFVLIHRQMGQMFLIGFQGLTLSPEIRHLIEHYYIGNIIFARRNITGVTHSINTN
jgi:hypothetical protein